MAHVFTENHQPRIPAIVASYFLEAMLLPAALVLLSMALI